MFVQTYEKKYAKIQKRIWAPVISYLCIVANPIKVTIQVAICNFVHNWPIANSGKKNCVLARSNVGI